jgi:hypothetical protein
MSRIISFGGVLAVCLATSSAMARDPTGKYANSPLASWFEAIHNKMGAYCCKNADGIPVEDSDWDVKKDHYWVRLNLGWQMVPDGALVTEPNKFGRAVVWLYDDLNNTSMQIRCFMPGSGV